MTELILFLVSTLVLLAALFAEKRISNRIIGAAIISLVYMLLFYYIHDEEISNSGLALIILYTSRAMLSTLYLCRRKENVRPVLFAALAGIAAATILSYLEVKPLGLSAWFFLVPFVEELFFRGLIFERLEGDSTLLASVLFAVLHSDTGSAVMVISIKLLRIGFSEILFSLRKRQASLWTLGLLHLGYNGAVVLAVDLLAGYVRL